MEVKGIVDILRLCWVGVVLKGSEIIFTKLSVVLSYVFIFWRMRNSLGVLIVNSLTRSLGKALSIEILTRDLGYVTGIAWDMLGLHICVWSSNPVSTFHRVVTKLKSLGT